MPRGVLGWARCGICGNSPATINCRGGLVVCVRCAYALAPRLGCEVEVKPARGSIEVDEELLRRVKERASPRP